MPTKEWTKTRHLLTFWVMKEDAEAFQTACAAEGKSQTDVLRDTVLVLIGKPASGHHACDSLEEARRKECEICLSRLP
jgi:hypothetical protein